MTVGLQGYFLSRVSVLRRVIWIVAGVMLIAPETISSVIGLVIGVVLYFVEKILSKKAVAA